VTAFAAVDLGVEFVEEWTDPDTGEVFLLSDMKQRRAARRVQEEQGATA
jgi:hypothetical protein